MWPDTLPDPQADGFAWSSPQRPEVADVLTGVTRLAIKARTAPMQLEFQCFFSKAEMQTFEGWYRDVIENHDGEFYARWIGGSRIVAFASNYAFSPIGSGWVLSATAIRTRIDSTICDEFLSDTFENIYRADLAATDIYEADLTAVDRYVPDFSLQFIADNEC
jgi:hypothetical protein